MFRHNSKPGAIITGLVFMGLCLSCSGNKNGRSDAKDSELQTEQGELTTARTDAVLPRIIAAYNVTKPSHLASNYDLGYTLFVISTRGVLLTEDASTEYDYHVMWNDTHLMSFSDSGAVVDFGDVVNLNSDSEAIELGQIMISSKTGALVDVPFLIPDQPEAGFPLSISCQTLLVDSTGIVCALGFSSKP